MLAISRPEQIGVYHTYIYIMKLKTASLSSLWNSALCCLVSCTTKRNTKAFDIIIAFNFVHKLLGQIIMNVKNVRLTTYTHVGQSRHFSKLHKLCINEIENVYLNKIVTNKTN